MEEAQKRNKSQKLEKLAFLVYWFVIVLALGWISRGLGKKIEAQSCNIPTTVDTTIEVTPTSSDNVIDCSGQDITVVNGGKIIVHSYKTSDADVNNDGGAIIKVNNLTIEAGGEITADGEGYAPGDSEPVNAQESNGYAGGSGGGYGGAGGIGNTPGGSGNVPGTPGTTAGDKESPLLLGGAGGNTAGGGEGGKGGGAIKIEASGTVEINGRISANGTDGTIAPDSQTAGGGGAGGSVWIIGDILTGNGTVEAKGGGTDATANYIGGGGGGGRVVLMALSSTSFSGTIDVSGGHGSQDGGVGTIMGPGVKPADPTVTKVYETKLDNYGHPVAGTVNREVPYQGYTQKKDLTFASDMHGDTIHLEIEVRKVTESFTGTPTHVQSGWDTSKDCTGMPTSGDFDIGSYCGYVVVNGLATSVQYKWRARVVSDKGFKSNWVDVGTNGINDPDFSISGPLDTILISAGNNQTGIVGQQLPVDPKVQAVDANGIPVPLDEGYTWQVTEGGGGLANVQTTTDANGFLTAEWTLGTVAGSNNQKLTVSKGDVNTQLVASADPGPIYGYEIDTGDIINWPTNTGFTYKVTAVDQYGNKTNSNATLTVTPVKSNDVTTPGVGTLSPSSITLTNGEVTINDATYTDQESIKIQVKDSNNRVGYSKSILFVDPNGTNCPAITIDRDQTWDASTVSGGVFDCRGLGTLTVKGGYTLTLKSYDNGDNDWGNDYGVTILADDMVIEGGGVVSGDELGYQGSRGPGHRVDGGASYGGYGIDEVQPYGSAYEPAELGSAAPSEWYGHWTYAGGGGAMKLEVGGEMRIDGTITAVGAEAADGLNHSGSTGGAIWIDTGVLSGGGVIRADGGGSNKGGSGGRIAIYYSTDNSDILNTIGTVDPHVHAWGGNGAASGTIYVEHKGVDVSHGGLLYIDNNGHDWRSAALVPDTYNFSKLILKRYGHLRVLGNDTVFEVASGQVEGDNTKPRLEVEGTIKSASPFTVDGFDLVVLGDIQLGDSNENSTLILGGNIGGKMSLFAHTWAHNAANGYKFKEIDIKTDSTLFLWSYDNGDTDWSNDYGITLEAVNINIEASGSLSGYALGYRGMHGPGHDWGASHGGYADGTASYGDMFEPFELGSGSGVDRIGGAGGSAIKLIVTDELRNDGEITVDGEDKCDDYDAGAGGSLWLDINVLSGSGTLTADGGRDSCGSYGYQHGAGGRIAIYYYTDDSDILSTLGTDNPKVHAWAGQGYGGNSGTGPGTIYIEHKGVDPHHGGSLYIDNNGNTGRAQDLEPREYTFHNVYIGSGTYMKIKSDINAVPQGEEHPVTGRGPVLNITGDFTLASGAVLDGTGEGFPAGLGYGAGQNGIGNGGGAGGSHGGKGGRGQDDGVNGEADSGDTYGHQLQPFTIGSGGGNGGTGNLGGAGGSAIAIIALGKYNPTTNEYDYGNVTIHGTIRVNGADGRIGSPGGGGGAGGSILIEANSCAIDGVLEARGGRGGESDYDGGGGGGGRISPLYAKGPCVVENGTFDVSGGEPVNPSAYHAQAGQVGTMPPAPNTIPIPPRDKRQYAVYGTNSVEIPLGAVITTTSVELEADVYDVGATSTNPKHLKLQFELKKVGEAFDGSTGIYDSNVITFTGGDPARLRVNISNLDFGQSYKWRVRAVNADNGIVTPWVEYGDNGDTADFTISTVKSLSLEANKLTVDLDEPISLTVKALNAVGSVDDSYRGQVHFSSTASNVTLPADYTFVSEDNGEHVFTNSLVFHEVGTFTVKVEDAVNPTLYDTVDITVRPPASPFVSIGADKVQVQPGDPVELIWLTGYVTNPRIDPDIGAVDPSGHTTVVFNQVGQYTYTITGDTYDGGQLTSSVTIFVGEQQATGTVYVTQPVYITQTVTVTVPVTVTITPSITSVPSATTTPTTVYVKPGEGNQESRVCPIIKSFGANKTKVTKDEKVKLSWNVENAKQVSINILGKDLPLTGNSEVLLERTTTVRLTAVRGDCTREQTIIVKVVDKHCDYIGWLLLVALLVWDALSIPLGGLAGNIWLVVFLLVNKLLKNKRIRGSVLDIDSKEPLSGIIVELWEVNKNKLVDVEITDANGSFQFAVGNGDYVLKVANKDYVFPPASKKLEGLEGIYGNVYVGEVIKPQAGQQIDMLVEVKDKDAMYRYRGFGDYLAEVNVKWFTWPVIVSLVLYGIGLLYSVYVLIMWPLVCNGVLLLAWILIGVVKVIGLVKKPRYIQKAQYLQYMLGKQL